MYEWISKHLIFVGCLDILTTAHQMGLTFFEEEKDKQASTKVYAKEDFFVLNRFESKRSELLQSLMLFISQTVKPTLVSKTFLQTL